MVIVYGRSGRFGASMLCKGLRYTCRRTDEDIDLGSIEEYMDILASPKYTIHKRVSSHVEVGAC